MIYSIFDKVIMKKPHACGENEWIIIRTGADIKLKCAKCGRIVMLGYEDFVRSVKKTIPQDEADRSDKQE